MGDGNGVILLGRFDPAGLPYADQAYRGVCCRVIRPAGQEVEVHYRWNALYGRRVRRQYVERRAAAKLFTSKFPLASLS